MTGARASLVLCVCIVVQCCAGLRPTAAALRAYPTAVPRAAIAPCMLAKKKAKKRSSGKGSAKRGGGAPQPVTYAASGTPPAASTGRPAPGSEFASTVDPSAPIEDRLDDVLQKAGIARTQEDMPFAQPQSSG